MNRRDFLKLSAAGLCAPWMPAAYADVASVNASTLLDVHEQLNGARIVILMYGRSKFYFDPTLVDAKAYLVVIDAGTGAARYQPAQIDNLHAFVSTTAHNPSGLIFGVGQGRDLGVFHRDLTLRDIIRLDGIVWRGHGVPHEHGVLLTAQDTTRSGDANNGLLVYLDAAGRMLDQHETGGLHPHEVVDCGTHYAVAHYGVLPKTQTPADGLPLSYQSNKPVRSGVSFLNKKTLKVDAFHKTSDHAISGHMTALADGSIVVNCANMTKFEDEASVLAYAEEHGCIPTRDELLSKEFSTHPGFYVVHPEKGVIKDIECRLHEMRGGQSVARDPVLNIVASTWSDSQTIRVELPGKAPKILSTLPFGVPLPRGCAFIPGTGCAVITGQKNNAAVIDLINEKLIVRYGLPMARHSHAHWFAAGSLQM